MFKSSTLFAPGEAYSFAPLKTVRADSLEKSDTLLLVNRNYPLNDYSPVLLSFTVSSRAENTFMNLEALPSLNSLFADAEKMGFSALGINSAYRTETEQFLLYVQASDKSLVQKPGESEHATGLAVDLSLERGSVDSMKRSGLGRWLSANAWRYGFVLRYPEGKELVTGISFEPWHFRYVSQPHAAVMYYYGLTLEEYLAWLDGIERYSVMVLGERYEVSAQKRGDLIEIPASGISTASYDNREKIIITTVIR